MNILATIGLQSDDAWSDMIKKGWSATESGGQFAPQSASYFEQVWFYFKDGIGGFSVALLLLAVVVLLRRLSADPHIQKRVRAPGVALYAYIAAFTIALMVKPQSFGLGRVFHIFSLSSLTLAAVLMAGLIFIDIVLIRMRKVMFPAIIRDLLVIIIFLIALIVVLGQQGLDLTAIVASAGFLGIVFGLAMQDTLGNVFAGLAIQVEKPFDVSDWVQFSEHEGRVREINWRSVKIETLDKEVVVIPNTVVTKSKVVNMSQPTNVLRRRTVLRLPFTEPPNKVKRVVTETLRRIPGILSDPPPVVFVSQYLEYAMEYRITYHITDLERRELLLDEVNAKLWYAMKRSGLRVPFPVEDHYIRFPMEEEKHEDFGEKDLAERKRLLSGVPFFTPLPAEDLEFLAANAGLQGFAAGEEVVRQGEAGYSFYVVMEGLAEVRSSTRDGGKEVELARIQRGGYFGEMSLMTGERRSATVVAAVDTEFLVVDKEHFKSVITKHPEVVNRISEIIVARKMQIAEGHKAHRKKEQQEEAEREQASLINRIKSFFKI